jgi:rhodanese-related sulfurtransferase
VAKRKITDKPKTPGLKKPAVPSRKQSSGAPAVKTGQAAQQVRRGQSVPSKKEIRRQDMRRREIPWFTIAIFGMILGGLAVILLYRAFYQPNIVETPAEVSVADAYQMYQDGVFLLDVREKSEWDEYHIPRSTLIPLEELQSRTAELPRNQEIVVVCRTGNRSQEGRDILINAGFKHVTSMEGGLVEWREAGYPVE